jgi:hypothetical protein
MTIVTITAAVALALGVLAYLWLVRPVEQARGVVLDAARTRRHASSVGRTSSRKASSRRSPSEGHSTTRYPIPSAAIHR